MSRSLILASTMFLFCSEPWAHELLDEAGAGRVVVIDHADVRAFTMNGNSLQGLATRSNGVRTHEVWRSSVAPGQATPVHTHSSEEVFVVLTGEGVVRVGGREVPFKAPCTIIAPAGVTHQVINTGNVPSDSIVIVTVGSDIHDANDEIMQLPWRQ